MLKDRAEGRSSPARLNRGDVVWVLALVVAFGVVGGWAGDLDGWRAMVLVLAAGLTSTAVVSYRQHKRRQDG